MNRAPLFSLWTHKRHGGRVMADKNRINVHGIRQVRLKRGSQKPIWIDLDKLIEDYVMDEED